MPSERIALLVIDSALCRIAANSLGRTLPDLTVIVEERVSRLLLLRGRLKRFGIVHVAGQLAFMSAARLLGWVSRRRIAEICRKFALEARWPADTRIMHVSSVNAPECIALLKQLDPKAVLVVGTRIIRRDVLSAVPVPFINYHDGITPKYRGIHGGYWAKAEDDPDNLGITIHLIDLGIDTGAVLYQERLKPEPNDNYATVSYLQLAAALPLIEQAARDAVQGKIAPRQVDLPSRLWSHPTLWTYVATGLRCGAW
jgi:folate-dependent phosphoribosylglycinamide formyltransferase PurN